MKSGDGKEAAGEREERRAPPAAAVQARPRPRPAHLLCPRPSARLGAGPMPADVALARSPRLPAASCGAPGAAPTLSGHAPIGGVFLLTPPSPLPLLLQQNTNLVGTVKTPFALTAVR